jgi:hypothetical protein
MTKTLIKTFDNDIYIIEGKGPEEVIASMEGLDYVGMPNGSYIHRKSISAFQTYEDYAFQAEQKMKHRQGQYLRGGNWNDNAGIVEPADLFRITGDSIKRLKEKNG